MKVKFASFLVFLLFFTAELDAQEIEGKYFLTQVGVSRSAWLPPNLEERSGFNVSVSPINFKRRFSFVWTIKYSLNYTHFRAFSPNGIENLRDVDIGFSSISAGAGLRCKLVDNMSAQGELVFRTPFLGHNFEASRRNFRSSIGFRAAADYALGSGAPVSIGMYCEIYTSPIYFQARFDDFYDHRIGIRAGYYFARGERINPYNQ